MFDYRNIRLSNLTSPQFRHVLLLLFWPAFGLLFGLLERGGVTDGFHMMYCALDDAIPFCEYFLPAYLFWFVYLPGMLLYTLFFDVPQFKKMMYFIIATYTVTIIFYMIYPTAQGLRPTQFQRDNIFTRFMAWFYTFDTNTNVCPSIHVLGSLAAMNAAWYTKRFATPGWRAANVTAAVLICVSTCFVKQHSVIDVLAALPLCAAAWFFIYVRKKVPAKNR